jgi:hypothetical protein
MVDSLVGVAKFAAKLQLPHPVASNEAELPRPGSQRWEPAKGICSRAATPCCRVCRHGDADLQLRKEAELPRQGSQRRCWKPAKWICSRAAIPCRRVCRHGDADLQLKKGSQRGRSGNQRASGNRSLGGGGFGGLFSQPVFVFIRQTCQSRAFVLVFSGF